MSLLLVVIEFVFVFVFGNVVVAVVVVDDVVVSGGSMRARLIIGDTVSGSDLTEVVFNV